MEVSELHTGEEARAALAQLEQRLRRDVDDMLTVLAADVPVFVRRTVRRVFERSAHSDGLDAAGLKALKQGTEEQAERLGRELSEALRPFELWTWEPGRPLPEDPQGLDEHPRVAEVLGRVEGALCELLSAQGYPESELSERLGYVLPSYFVAGHFMKSLVANYWRALRDYHELSQRIGEAETSEQRQARRDRWEQA